jgi:hypothetical protein
MICLGKKKLFDITFLPVCSIGGSVAIDGVFLIRPCAWDSEISRDTDVSSNAHKILDGLEVITMSDHDSMSLEELKRGLELVERTILFLRRMENSIKRRALEAKQRAEREMVHGSRAVGHPEDEKGDMVRHRRWREIAADLARQAIWWSEQADELTDKQEKLREAVRNKEEGACG